MGAVSVRGIIGKILSSPTVTEGRSAGLKPAQKRLKACSPWISLIALITTVFLLRSSAVVAQPADSSSWVWPEAEVREALSYIRILPHDLGLRTDYVKVDPWRRKLVNEVMARPPSMPTVMQEFAALNTIKDDRDTRLIRLRCRDVSVTLNQTFGDAGMDLAAIPLTGIENTGLTLFWVNWLAGTVRACGDTTRMDRVLRLVPPEHHHLFRQDAIELVTEDEADRAKPAEVLDSMQRSEDTIAAHMLAWADKVTWGEKVLAMAFAVDERVLTFPTHSPFSGDATPCDTIQKLRTPIGELVIGTYGKDVFTGNPLVVIDPGGDDIYQLDPQEPGRARVIADWEGNDLYMAPDGHDLGCGFWNWGLLIDQAGDDTYRAGNFSLGAGWFGVGALYDLGGRDTYEGDTYTQGAGGWGLGVLYDGGDGNDRYNGALSSQGFGFTAGSGVLMDEAGNDTYFAGGKYEDILRYVDHYLSLSQGFGYGIRPHFSGGVGLLLDLNGHDVYTADIFGQGCSYWWGFGGLYDAAGNDQYTAYQYAQGSATHMTAGCLFDKSGDDTYSSKGVSQGCGHDWAPALLIDGTGDDRYTCTDLSQAAGSANGVAVLIDGGGNDVYNAKDTLNTQGYGNPRRDYGSIGLFLDLGGKDRYVGAGKDSKVWLSRSMWGVGVDADSTWNENVKAQQ